MSRLVEKLNNYIGPILMVMALVLGPVYFFEVRQQHAQASCFKSYNATFSQALTARSATSGARQDAEDALLSQVSALVLAPPTTDKKVQATRSAAFLKAFQDYETALGNAAIVKENNPYPTLPTC